MKKALIMYFSQGGSTKKTGEAVGRGLENSGYRVDYHDIAGKERPDVTGYDLIGVGSPVYIYRTPFNVMKVLKGLPPLKGKPFFVYIMYGTLPGSAANSIRKLLVSKGGVDRGLEKFMGADYFLGYLRMGYLFSPDEPSGGSFKRAEKFG